MNTKFSLISFLKTCWMRLSGIPPVAYRHSSALQSRSSKWLSPQPHRHMLCALVLAKVSWLTFSVALKGVMALNHSVTLLLAGLPGPTQKWLWSCGGRGDSSISGLMVFKILWCAAPQANFFYGGSISNLASVSTHPSAYWDGNKGHQM